MVQNYDSAPSRNSSVNAGTKPAKVSVAMPGTDRSRKGYDCKPGSKVKAPAGFSGNVIPGKV